MAGEQPPDGNGRGAPWFNDRRFNFVTSRHQLQQNLTQIGREMNNALSGNPAVLGQLRQQLEIISDMIRQGQGGPQEEAAVGPTAGANAVVLDMTLGPAEQPPPVNDAADEVPSSSGASDDEQEDGAEQQQPAGPDGTPLPTPPGGNLNAEVRRIRELVRSPEIQRIIVICLRILPFVAILLLKLLIDHAVGLAALALSVVCFVIADLSVSKAVASRGSGQLALIKGLLC
uniref:Uncharacterized protein n=1 Tax=Plectus sambesii TaxID=2011161 RepID=A0A914VQ00_9BILA